MAIDINPATPTQSVLKLVNFNQNELRDVSIQIASSNKHEDFKGFAEDGTVEKLISFNESIDRTNSYITSNDIILARVNTTDQTMVQLQDIASNVAQLIAQRRNSASGEDTALDIQGRAILNDIAGKLNVKFDGRYLFSGTKTNTKPFSNPQISNIDSTDNSATTSYYSGGSSAPTIKINDTQELEYGILGNDIAFQQLIGAVNLAIDGHTNNNDDTLADAMEMINSAVSNLASARATIGSAKLTLSQANSIHRDVNILISENLLQISQTDIVQATTRMSELEATIQATYLAFTKLNALRLANFLQ